ncbi:ribonuclease H-like domain-containing protein [Podospora aff. communis PSN243]|uniref:Ribonuclease H-like domain-containing protein n=1 Tax=Podospora aff. communis PSN243 TaxID=3040156 RepID=A0AAV9HA18_9PEZI|nr:ribonuclease H-like domain-containing protein [Podospora aff. communis PSN243]
MERQVLNVDQSNFWPMFPAIIEAISYSEFVSFDLDMTGVKTRTDGWTESHKQQTYQQAKAAAQIFNILQVGISCAFYDEDKRVSFSSNALIFSQSNGFSLERAFAAGIPYLSRTEAGVAQGLYSQSLEVTGRNTGPHGRGLGARAGIRAPSWRRIIHPPSPLTFCDNDKPEPTDSRTCPDSHYPRKPCKDVVEMTAFRYVVEAILGSDFADEIHAQIFCNPEASESALDKARSGLKAAETGLKNCRPLIVGHNPLFDLCFLHETFIGRLAGDIKSFAGQIHKLLPRLVDTKHLDIRPGHGRSKFPKALPKLQVEAVPKTLPATNDNRDYQNAHQAGFDSFMTMVVFLKASAEMAKVEVDLRCRRQEEGAEESSSPTSATDAFAKLNLFGPKCIGNDIAPSLTAASNERVIGKEDEEKVVERPIAGWETKLWAKYANKIRMGSKAVLNLEGTSVEEDGVRRQRGERRMWMSSL